MRLVISLYLLWQRLEVAFVALLVPGLIIESSIANGWVYGGGPIGFLRGFFFEILTYVTARQAFILGKRRNWLGCILMTVVALAAIYTSAFNNLGWVMAGHELAGLLSTMGQMMGNNILYHGYQFFLAVLLPVSVGAIALIPLDHFFEHVLDQDHLDNKALQVDERHMHRTAYLKEQRAQRREVRKEYKEIARERARGFVDQVRAGDLSFGAGPASGTRMLNSGSSREVEGTVFPADEAGTWSQGYQQQWSPQSGPLNTVEGQWTTMSGR
ncbi:hypothetical protein KSC_046110 [Ktedonobacter sp. SOSP1-52]|uniref:hypothetical protein n=1 Tax=Ktedonobacter sp. SOSP1-52 TaxID=2778366 RepID=UPI0019164BDE|nr:hypothetical protein [Ktedonobacter sp. SOSP1-52]GHO65719.1 hypothetical protein KSC_046110 [Ktedonobacter sp. SOSP1-52]